MRKLRGLKDPLMFGKYADLNIKQIYHKDPSYVRWLYREQVLTYTSPSSQELFREMATKHTTVKWPMGLAKADHEARHIKSQLQYAAHITQVRKALEPILTHRYNGSSEREMLEHESAIEDVLREEYCGDR